MDVTQNTINAAKNTPLIKKAKSFCPFYNLPIFAIHKLARVMLKTKLPRTYHFTRFFFFLNGYFIMRARSALKQQVKQSIIAQQKITINANSWVIMFVA
jgi:hypothetical protein